jgi:hypothetical protein
MIDKTPPTVSNLTPTEFGILDGLRVYRFLTVAQMEKLGIGKQKGQITHVLPDMVRSHKPSIGKIVPGTLPKLGRLPNVYYLTEHGAATIADANTLDHDKVKYPKRVTMTSVHFWHRAHAIDCHIAVRKWAEKNNNRLDYYHDYFEYTGSNRSKTASPQRSVNRVEYSGGSIIPDAIFQLTDDANRSRFCALELYNQNRPQRTFEKMLEYCHAISEKALTQAFNYPHMPRILMVFDLDAALITHLARAREHASLKGFHKFFYFKVLQDMEANFLTGWQRLDGLERVSLF